SMKLRPGNTSVTRSRRPLIGAFLSPMHARNSNGSIHHFHRDEVLVWQFHPACLSFLYRLVTSCCHGGVAASERAVDGIGFVLLGLSMIGSSLRCARNTGICRSWQMLSACCR